MHMDMCMDMYGAGTEEAHSSRGIGRAVSAFNLAHTLEQVGEAIDLGTLR